MYAGQAMCTEPEVCESAVDATVTLSAHTSKSFTDDTSVASRCQCHSFHLMAIHSVPRPQAYIRAGERGGYSSPHESGKSFFLAMLNSSSSSQQPKMKKGIHSTQRDKVPEIGSFLVTGFQFVDLDERFFSGAVKTGPYACLCRRQK